MQHTLSTVKKIMLIAYFHFKLMLNLALWDYEDLEYNFQCYTLPLLPSVLHFVP